MEENPHQTPEIGGEDHGEFRQRFTEAHLDVVLTSWKEPHRKFVKRLNSDFLVHGAVPFYEVGEIRVRSATIVQKAGFMPNADDLLQISKADVHATVTNEEDVMNRIHAFLMTLEYLNNRKQFGQLIGSFQSLQHRAAKMFVELEMTRSCVAAALSAADAGKSDVAELASLAKAKAGELAHLVSNECVQMHGGIGMTDAAEPGFFMKRARVQEALYGSASWHRDRYAKLNGY
jgi:hypothetical protein